LDGLVEELGAMTEDDKKSRIQMVAAVVIVVVLISAAFGAYYVFFRHWTIMDVAKAVIDDPTPAAPGFKHSLAGKSIVVEGRVTNITTRSTTAGIFTQIELDHCPYVPLVEWGIPDYSIGNRIEKRVSFEWSNCNEERHVYSPQLAFPNLWSAPSVEVVMRAVNWVSDGAYLETSWIEGRDIRVDVTYVRDPILLSEVNCTLKAGRHSWAAEYMDTLGNYPYNNATDRMASLLDRSGVNGSIRFFDNDTDLYLDEGDYFLLRNLTLPATESGMNTYLLMIEWPSEPEMSSYSKGLALTYVPLIQKGLMRYDVGDTPGVRMMRSSVDSGVRYTVRTVVDHAPNWSNLTLMLYGPDFINAQLLNFSSSAMTGPPLASQVFSPVTVRGTTLQVEATDELGNGLLDVGDSITVTCISGSFPANSSYQISLMFNPTGSSVWMTTFVPDAIPVCSFDAQAIPTGLDLSFRPVHTGLNLTYAPFDVPWDEVNVELTDGNASVNWTFGLGALSWGRGGTSDLSTQTLGALTVGCNATDLEGNGLVNRGDSIDITTCDTGRFLSSCNYTIFIMYIHMNSVMCSATFTG
jgi:hypothetical protein